MGQFTQDVTKHQGRFTGRVDVSDDDANALAGGVVVMLVSARADDAELKTLPNGDVRRTAVLKVEDFKILSGEARLDGIQQLLKTQVPELEEQTEPIQTIVHHEPSNNSVDVSTVVEDEPGTYDLPPFRPRPAEQMSADKAVRNSPESPTQSVEDLLASVRAGRNGRASEDAHQRPSGGPQTAPTASGRSRKDPFLQKLYDDPTFVGQDASHG